MKNFNKYEEEIEMVLKRMKDDTRCPSNIDYFIEQLISHHLEENFDDKECVYVFGASVPEEFIRGMGLKPIWILGGSHQAGFMAEDTFPRDVDPVVKSSYGMFRYLTQNSRTIPKVVIPYQNDSFRKLSWIMTLEDVEVINLDVPSVKDMVESRQIFQENNKQLIKNLEKKFQRTLKPYLLYEATLDIEYAKNMVRQLLKLCEEKTFLLSATTLYGIVSAYYSAGDLKVYAKEVERVIKELKKVSDVGNTGRPKIWVLGSPLFFPNNKLISMGEDLSSDVTLYRNEMTMFFKGCSICEEKTKQGMINKIASHYYDLNRMPLNIEETFKMTDDSYKRDGVIFHLLKGEVAYDYDLIKVESFFKKMQMPVLRVETDYSPEDKEQLKIRVEAFVEMLKQYA